MDQELRFTEAEIQGMATDELRDAVTESMGSWAARDEIASVAILPEMVAITPNGGILTAFELLVSAARVAFPERSVVATNRYGGITYHVEMFKTDAELRTILRGRKLQAPATEEGASDA